MNISVKIRKENFEDGEYTPEQLISKDKVINFFESYEWVKDSELTNECLFFFNKKKELFCIEKYGKEAFQVYIIDFSTRYYLHKTTKSLGVIKALNKFINNQKLGNEDKFIQESDRSFVNSFKEKTFSYKTNFFVNVCIGFVWLTMMLLNVVYSVFILTDNRGDETLVMLLLPLPALIFVWLPGFIVHFNYWLSNRNTEIYISSGNNEFILKQNGAEHIYLKSEIKEVIQYQSDSRAWDQYGYTKVIFKNNTSLALTNLLIHQLKLSYKFPSHTSIVKKRFFSWLINKSC